MPKIPNSDQCKKKTVGNTNQRNKWAYTNPLIYRGGIRCLGGVSITCWSINPAVNPITWSWMRTCPLSKSVCQVRSNYWYEKCHRTYGAMKVCNYKLDHCNGHRTCESLASIETVEIPVSLTCLSVVYFDSKLILCRAGPCISNQLRDVYPVCRW
jgi:hypothetical protein